MSEKSVPEGQVALILITFLSALIISLIPIWSVELPPLQDYPAHLARMHILGNLENSPALQSIYEIRWELLPNLAMDAVVPLLTTTIPLFDAGRLFVSVIVLMWIGGPLILHHALFGRWSLWPLIASFFVYNWCLSTGLLNFSFGAGLFFVVMAAWVYSKNWPPIWRLLLFSLLSTVLYFCHLVAFGIYGLAVAGFEAGRAYQKREFLPSRRVLWHWSIVFGQFVVPLVMFLFFSPKRAENIYWGGYWGGDWAGMRERLNGLRAPVLFELGIIDHLTLLFTAAIFIYALVTRSLKIHPAFLWAFPLLIVAAILMPLPPPTLWHMRLPSVIAPLLFAGTAWVGTISRKGGLIIFTLALALFLTRAAVVTDRWQLQDARISEFREAAMKIEEGSSLFLVLSSNIRPGLMRTHVNSVYPLLHMADYATIDRSAFVASVFADRGKQVIRARGSYATIYGGIPYFLGWDELLGLAPDQEPTIPVAGNWRESYDYLILLNLEDRELLPPDFLTVLHEGSFFTIFEIDKSKIPQQSYGGLMR
jgi:hypothetical protein